VSNGGEIVQPIEDGRSEITALFKDPAGNFFGIYQHGG
jgi:predicted enzyme related to lactoylglutathione lyase